MPSWTQRNLANADASLAGSPLLRTKLRLGVGGLRAGKAVAKGVDSGVSSLLDATLKPGGALAGAAGSAAGSAYNTMKSMPGASKYLAVGLPAYLAFEQDAGKAITDLANETRAEGRTVMAELEFVEKKAALEERILEKASGFGQSLLGGLAGIKDLPGYVGGETAGAHNASGYIGGSVAGGILNNIGNAAGSIGKSLGDTTGYRLNRSLNPLTTRVRADEQFAQNFFSTLGSETAKGLTGLLRDMAGKAMSGIVQGPAHASMVENLARTDPMIARADPQLLINAYDTMAKFAPTLATDENAVRSFLREAVAAGNGPDYASIANLAKAEATLMPKRGP